MWSCCFERQMTKDRLIPLKIRRACPSANYMVIVHVFLVNGTFFFALLPRTREGLQKCTHYPKQLPRKCWLSAETSRKVTGAHTNISSTTLPQEFVGLIHVILWFFSLAHSHISLFPFFFSVSVFLFSYVDMRSWTRLGFYLWDF